MGRPYIIDPEWPRKLLNGDINMAPAVERSFPPGDELPRVAVLSWFCHQLSLQGTQGDSDLTLPVVEGHEFYLGTIEQATKELLNARKL